MNTDELTKLRAEAEEAHDNVERLTEMVEKLRAERDKLRAEVDARDVWLAQLLAHLDAVGHS